MELIRQKQKILRYFVIIGACLGLFFTVFNLYMNYKPGVYTMVSYSGLILVFLVLFHLRLISFRVITNLSLALTSVFAVGICTYYSGGLFSPVTAWFVLVPVLALLISASERLSVLWLVVTVTMLGVFTYLQIHHKVPAIQYDQSKMIIYFSFCHIGLTLILFVLTFVFEKKINYSYKQLNESRIQLELIYNSSVDAMCLFRIQNNELIFESVNHAFVTFTGLQPDQINGRSMDTSLPGHFVKSIRSAWKESILREEPVLVQETVKLNPNVLLEMRVMPIKDDRKVYSKLLLVAKNTYEQRKIQEQTNVYLNNLRENKELYAQHKILLECSNLPVEMPYDEQIKQIIRKTAHTLGCERVSFWFSGPQSISTEIIYRMDSRQYLDGVSLTKKRHPVFFRELEKGDPIIATSVNGHPALSELRVDYFEPLNIHSLLCFPIRINETLAGMICCEQIGSGRAWNVNEQNFVRAIAGLITVKEQTFRRVKAEEALKKSEYSLREAQKLAKLGSWEFNLITRELFWSPELYRLFDLVGTPDNILYDEMRNRYHPDDIALLDLCLHNAITNKKGYTIEHRIICGNGAIKFIYGIAEVMLSREGEVIGLKGTAQDITERKRAEEALIKSEQHLQTILHVSPVPLVIVKKKDDKVMTCNQAFRTLMGASHQTHQSARITSVFNDEKLLYNIKEQLEKGLRIRYTETKVENLLGRQIDCLLSVENVMLNDEPGYIIGLMDISDRKRMETELSDSEQVLRKLFDASPIPMLTSRVSDGLIIRVNDSASKMMNLSPEELIGRSTSDFYKDPSERQKMITALKAMGGLRNYELELKRPDNRVISTLVSNEIVKMKGEQVILTGFVDVTDRVQINEALKSSEQNLNTIFNVSPLPIIIARLKDGIIIRANEETEKLFEENGGGLAGKSICDYYKSLDKYHSLLSEIIDKGCIRNWETVFVTKTGREVPCIISTELIEMNGEKVILKGIVDLTERKSIEIRVKKINEELEQKVAQRTMQLKATNKELEAFSYSVSHDLRAPLRGIDGWSLALAEDYADKLGDEGRKYIERVRSETQRMGVLIDDLLKLAKITNSDVDWQDVDMSVIAKPIAARLIESFPQRKLEFVIQSNLNCKGNPNFLEIMITNLFDNAVKFTSRKEVASIEFGCKIENHDRIFFIRDNGVGFSMNASKNLFGAFQRMHSQKDFPGTGIGLATVKRIILNHHGRIWAESEPDKGTVFYFTINEV